MRQPKKYNCRVVAQALECYGVRDVVVSPGSRNTPLIMAVGRCPKFNCIPVIDERSAAFIGLGIAAITARPVALVCTSGSALLNYAPAISEAYYRKLPLIVVSADRPAFWIGHDDSQTIKQPHALANFILGECDIPDREPDGTA
ncbi:MAG: 2-succinyl-5-enolpyruvyl-6-hydroxy-3-cyclohexene-1-carboxylic-acid synthase, partial [Muribaculaceae bacterium]|nr:2-succinyl-5-enolpyruvyl-6-hydroxy-3-cyclohexene-1-carboxylic-acid synthase [Muribaculaceae bacterium]